MAKVYMCDSGLCRMVVVLCVCVCVSVCVCVCECVCVLYEQSFRHEMHRCTIIRCH